MRKKRPKQKPLPTPPITYRCIYSAKSPWIDGGPIIYGVVFSAVGTYMFSQKEYLYAIPSAFIAILMFGTLVKMLLITVRSVNIDGGNLIIDYIITKNICKASDIKSVSWQTGLYERQRRGRGTVEVYISHYQNFPGDLGPSGDFGNQFDRRSFLLLEMKNGKRVEIPGSPYSQVDMQKTLLDWLEKYKPTDREENAAQ